MGVKRGHMVTRAYIAAWADARNIVDVIDLQDGRKYPTSIYNATVVSYVYDPLVLTHDLEKAYGKIEGAAKPVIRKLCGGAQPLTVDEVAAMIDFLDMHLDRGRYADQAKLRGQALLVKTGGNVEAGFLGVGDALLLSQSLPEVLRLRTLGLDQWEWRVWPLDTPIRGHASYELVTGDGAVLLWRPTKDAEICTVSFPLSPSRLLVVGRDLPDGVRMNDHIAANSKRWVVGTRGSLQFTRQQTASG